MLDFNVKEYLKSLLPEANYTFKIVGIDVKPTAKTIKGQDNSRFLQVNFQVISPSQKGFKLFDNINIYHSSEVPRRIGRERFAALCEAVELLDINNWNQLMGKIVDGTIIHEWTSTGTKLAKIDKYIKCIAHNAAPQSQSSYEELMKNTNADDSDLNDEIPF